MSKTVIRDGDVRVIPDELVDQYTERGWAPQPAAPADQLKGKDLDHALEAAGLSKAGTADEKRERLAEHQDKSLDTQEQS